MYGNKASHFDNAVTFLSVLTGGASRIATAPIKTAKACGVVSKVSNTLSTYRTYRVQRNK